MTQSNFGDEFIDSAVFAQLMNQLHILHLKICLAEKQGYQLKEHSGVLGMKEKACHVL